MVRSEYYRMSELSTTAIQDNLPTKIFGRQVHYYPQIDSTNNRLKQLADQGIAEGVLLLADEQLSGRGRFERTWYAPPGSSLLTSLLFRPAFLSPIQAQQLTMICALAMVEAILDQTGLAVGLKWPNDLVYHGRKLAGILTELGFVGHRLEWAVVGLGLNVNFDFSTLAEAKMLQQTATSLQSILGRPISRLALLRAYLVQVEQRYLALRAGQSPFADWVQKLETLGKMVTVSDLETTFSGLAESVTETGTLQVRLADGGLVSVMAGDVTLKAG